MSPYWNFYDFIFSISESKCCSNASFLFNSSIKNSNFYCSELRFFFLISIALLYISYSKSFYLVLIICNWFYNGVTLFLAISITLLFLSTNSLAFGNFFLSYSNSDSLLYNSISHADLFIFKFSSSFIRYSFS